MLLKMLTGTRLLFCDFAAFSRSDLVSFKSRRKCVSLTARLVCHHRNRITDAPFSCREARSSLLTSSVVGWVESVCLSAGIAAGGGGGRREVLGAEAAGRLLPPLELLLPLYPLHVEVEQEVVGLVVLRARRVGVALLEVGRRLMMMLLVVVMMLLLLMMLSKPKLQEDYQTRNSR